MNKKETNSDQSVREILGKSNLTLLVNDYVNFNLNLPRPKEFIKKMNEFKLKNDSRNISSTILITTAKELKFINDWIKNMEYPFTINDEIKDGECCIIMCVRFVVVLGECRLFNGVMNDEESYLFKKPEITKENKTNG